jgi:hypothetical protein
LIVAASGNEEAVQLLKDTRNTARKERADPIFVAAFDAKALWQEY